MERTSALSSSPASASALMANAPRSPGRKKGTNLLQRQVARALELIELLEETSAHGAERSCADGYASSPSVGPASAFRVRKVGKSAFTNASTSLKRKRTASLSIVTSAEGEKDAEPNAVTPHRKGRPSLKKLRDGRGTPSKRCGGKAKPKRTKPLGDAIENALQKFRAEKSSTDRAFEFTCKSSAQEEVDALSTMRVHVGVSTAQGTRAYMEDRYAVVTDLMDEYGDAAPKLLAVYDGHNGPFAAEYARKRFRELLRNNELLHDLAQHEAEDLDEEKLEVLKIILSELFLAVDEEILRVTMEKGKRDGTTVLLGLLVGGKLIVANAGDSRAVLSHSDGQVKRISVDHKPDMESEKQRVEEAGGKVIFSGCWRVAHDQVPLRLAISRSLGDHPLKANLPTSCSEALVSAIPDIQVVDVEEDNDVIVFASDGLWDRFTDKEAAEFARSKLREYNDEQGHKFDSLSPGAVKHAASSLVDGSLRRRSMDNITAMVISWKRGKSELDALSQEEVSLDWTDTERSIDI